MRVQILTVWLMDSNPRLGNMKSLRQLSTSWLLVIAAGAVFGPPASAQVESAPSKAVTKSDPLCPTISVSCPSSFEDGKTVTATATVRGDAASIATYDWSIHGGTITRGHGTSTINFNVDAGRDSYSVSVKVGGFDSSCSTTASCSTIVCKGPSAVKSDSYGSVPLLQEKGTLDGFATILNNQPGSMGYILSYAPRRNTGASRTVGERAKTYLVHEKGIDAGRVVIVEAGLREKLTVDLWVVPTGATPPEADPPSPRALPN